LLRAHPTAIHLTKDVPVCHFFQVYKRADAHKTANDVEEFLTFQHFYVQFISQLLFEKAFLDNPKPLCSQ